MRTNAPGTAEEARGIADTILGGNLPASRAAQNSAWRALAKYLRGLSTGEPTQPEDASEAQIAGFLQARVAQGKTAVKSVYANIAGVRRRIGKPLGSTGLAAQMRDALEKQSRREKWARSPPKVATQVDLPKVIDYLLKQDVKQIPVAELRAGTLFLWQALLGARAMDLTKLFV